MSDGQQTQQYPKFPLQTRLLRSRVRLHSLIRLVWTRVSGGKAGSIIGISGTRPRAGAVKFTISVLWHSTQKNLVRNVMLKYQRSGQFMKDILVHHSSTVGTPIGYSDQLLALVKSDFCFQEHFAEVNESMKNWVDLGVMFKLLLVAFKFHESDLLVHLRSRLSLLSRFIQFHLKIAFEHRKDFVNDSQVKVRD